jgi:Domain of unknown function (DUF4440)
MEHDGWEALASGRAGGYYRSVLTPDALMAFPFGVMTRDAAIAAMESAPPWQSYELSAERVVPLGDQGGVLVYEVVAQRRGEAPYAAVVSSSYVLQRGRWQLAFHQQSPRDEPQEDDPAA